ncbi:MAG: hypothetical protein SOW56_06105 [Bacteroidaceae bacterium]|nr:hypothetical protein [Bacteroidaceae bacterium]
MMAEIEQATSTGSLVEGVPNNCKTIGRGNARCGGLRRSLKA